jgi:membrane protein YdbS with pleckstrin-like domain
MNIATSNTREKYPLSYKKIMKKTLAPSIAWVLFLLFIYIFILIVSFSVTATQGSNPFVNILGSGLFMIPFFLLFGLYFLITYFYQRWYFAVYYYELTPDHIIIRKGPITPSEITIPYERIQDVYMDQDIFDRIFGIYDVHLSSATLSSGKQAHIDGLEKVAADGLKNELLGIITAKSGKR